MQRGETTLIGKERIERDRVKGKEVRECRTAHHEKEKSKTKVNERK